MMPTPPALANPVAVVDVETTGLFPQRHDRVVEIAVVVVGTSGSIEREFSSLINPLRDVGPTRIHGITAGDVVDAPRFEDIAGELLGTLRGTVAIAGHNVRFDKQFLNTELARLNLDVVEYATLCTMQLAGGGKLSECCEYHGISHRADSHCALNDARATAGLLISLLADDPLATSAIGTLKPIDWPQRPISLIQPLSRSQRRSLPLEQPSYLQRLLKRKGSGVEFDDGAMLAYGSLLDRVLEDRQIDKIEADMLIEVAELWGLSGMEINAVHRAYLSQLASQALVDGVVTEVEKRDLDLVARLLGQPALDKALEEAEERLQEARHGGTPPSTVSETLAGMTVCFTGELLCRIDGADISRERAELLAKTAGLSPTGTVTKKLDILVVADPHTQSGKAKKAREYGVRVMHEPTFWKAIGVSAG